MKLTVRVAATGVSDRLVKVTARSACWNCAWVAVPLAEIRVSVPVAAFQLPAMSPYREVLSLVKPSRSWPAM